MAKVPYDVRGVSPDEPPSASMSRERRSASPNGKRKVRRLKVADAPEPEPGSFAARVEARHVDLVKLIDEGLPPLEFLPASDGMLIRGKRHLISAPQKTGKSIGMLVHWVDVALAGGQVVIFDRENGQDIYARRLADILEARHLSEEERSQVRTRLRYHEFPELRKDDANELVAYLRDVDVVVFDAQRMFLSDFGFKESDSDDYAAFMSYVIDPLFRAKVATVILDNTGLGDTARARGTTAKGDLNEVLFSMDADDEFDTAQRGRLTLRVERTRIGNRGEWTMEIGGGSFDPWRTVERRERSDFKTYVLEALKDGKPRGVDTLVSGARKAGVTVGTDGARGLLKSYAEDPETPIIRTPRGYQLSEPA